MNLHVFLHVGMIAEGPTTLEAAKRSLAGMDAVMSHEVAPTGQHLSAFRALVEPKSIISRRMFLIHGGWSGKAVCQLASSWNINSLTCYG